MSPDTDDYACFLEFTFPMARCLPMQTADIAIDPTLDLCTRYPLRLGQLRQCGIQSWSNISTHDKYWESIPKPSYLEPNASLPGHLLPNDLAAQKATIHQREEITMRATSKNVLFPGHNHLLTTGTFNLIITLSGAQEIIKVSYHQYWWLAGGYDLEIEHV